MAKSVTLTPKQMAFARFLAEGESQSKAYRKAYNTNTKNPNVAAVAGHKLANDPRIVELVERLKAGDDKTAKYQVQMSREWVLERLREEAIQGDNPASVRVRALELVGKNLGMFGDESGEDAPRSAKEIEAKLSARLAHLFRGAEKLAKGATDTVPKVAGALDKPDGIALA